MSNIEPTPFGDKYLLVEHIATGGMAEIYRSQYTGIEGFAKELVVKTLREEFAARRDVVQMFLDEARVAGLLRHSNIVSVLDVGEDDDGPFLVMDYVEGVSPSEFIRHHASEQEPIPASLCGSIVSQIARGLHAAHELVGADGEPLALVHRDVSPQNVLVGRDGLVRVTDFGISKALGRSSQTSTGLLKGKVGYMSPEQARSETLDARSDLYSMAICLFEMITGERLLVTAGITTSADELYSRPVPLVSKKVPGLPPELDKVMLRALSVDPEHRYQTAAEFQEALLRCAHRHGLMMSAPELATHLRSVCGAHHTWRDEFDESQPVEGTELYGNEEGTQQINYAEEGQSDVLSVDGGDFVHAADQRRERAKTSLTLLGDLKGVELTSMKALGDSSGDGAAALVDLDSFGGSEASRGEPQRRDDPASSGIPLGRAGEVRPDNARPPAAAQNADEYTGVVVVQGSGKPPSEGVVSGVSMKPARALSEAVVPERSGHPWLMLTLVVLLGLGAAAAVGLTGKKLDTSEPSGSEAASSSNNSGS